MVLQLEKLVSDSLVKARDLISLAENEKSLCVSDE